jgi:hypothetical protein
VTFKDAFAGMLLSRSQSKHGADGGLQRLLLYNRVSSTSGEALFRLN